MTAEPLPEWAFPPPAGFTADDLDRIPQLPPHTELIDGSLIFVNAQKSFHSLVVDTLVVGLRAQAPQSCKVRREMTVTLNRRNRPEPDLMVVRADAVTEEADESGYGADDTLLVVEVVSPPSEERDRRRKPQLYAEAGIPHFWRVERGKGRSPVVYVHELDPVANSYVTTGIYRDRLTVKLPFPLDVDLTAVDRL